MEPDVKVYEGAYNGEQELLEKFQKFAHQSLKLSPCPNLLPDHLERILKVSRETLHTLQVSFCEGIDDNSVKKIAELCQSLVVLNLSGSNRVRSIVRDSGPILMSNLEELYLSNCESLEIVLLTAISLKKIDLVACKSLKQVCINLRDQNIEELKLHPLALQLPREPSTSYVMKRKRSRAPVLHSPRISEEGDAIFVQAFTTTIEFFWDHGWIEKIVTAFHRVQLLSEGVEQVVWLRKFIDEKVKGIKLEILLNANATAGRLKVKQQFAFLRLCCRLDVCFASVLHITEQFHETKKFLKDAELKKQQEGDKKWQARFEQLKLPYTFDPLRSFLLEIKQERQDRSEKYTFIETNALDQLCQHAQQHYEAVEREITRTQSRDLGKLQLVIERRDFFNFRQRLPGLLRNLQGKKPEEYISLCEELKSAILEWINPQAVSKLVQNSRWEELAKLLITLNYFAKFLSPFIEIEKDIKAALRVFENKKAQAIAEIADAALTQLHDILAISEFFKKYSPEPFDLAPYYEAAEKKWIALSEACQEPQEFPQTVRSMIRHFMLANLLGKSEQFQLVMNNVFVKMKDPLPNNLATEVKKVWLDFTIPTEVVAAHEFLDAFPSLPNVTAGKIPFSRLVESWPEKQQKSLLNDFKKFAKLYLQYSDDIACKNFKPEKNKVDALNCVKSFTDLRDIHANSPEVMTLLARIFAQWTFVEFGPGGLLKKPFSAQVLAVFCLIGIDNPSGTVNRLAEMKANEGQPLCVAVVATFFALLGYEVTVTSPHSFLSQQNYNKFSVLFEAFDLKEKIHYKTFHSLATSSSTPSIVEAIRDKSTLVTPRNSKTVLLIEEVDLLFGELYGKGETRLYPFENVYCKKLFNHMWNQSKTLLESHAKHEQDRYKEDYYQLIGKEKLKKLVKKLTFSFPNLSRLFPGQFLHMLGALKAVPSDGKMTPGYFLKDGKVYRVDPAGNMTDLISNYTTVFNYCSKEVSPPRQIFVQEGFQLYKDLPEPFSLKLGLTSTLQTLSEEELKLMDVFEARSYIPSSFDQKSIERSPIEIYKEREKYFSRIHEILNEKKSQPCFVICNDEKRAKEFQSRLANSTILSERLSDTDLTELLRWSATQVATQRIMLLKGRLANSTILSERLPDTDLTEPLRRSATQVDTQRITLLTRQFIRGLEFMRIGPIHLILTYYPETSAEQSLIESLACNRDYAGSISTILWAEDLYPVGFVEESWIGPYSHLNTDWSAIFAGKRKDKIQQRLEALVKELKINKEEVRPWEQIRQFIEKKDFIRAEQLLVNYNSLPPQDGFDA